MKFTKWNKYRSSNLNKDYYVNVITSQTQWEIPNDVDEIITGKLGVEWDIKKSTTYSNINYYYNKLTDIGTFIFPGIIEKDNCKNKICKNNEICNPKTGNCVLRTGKTGKELLIGKVNISNIYAVIDPISEELNKIPVKFNNIGNKNSQYKLGLDKNFKYEPINITGCTTSMEINNYLTKILTYKDKIFNLSVSGCKIDSDTITLLEQFNYLTTLNISKSGLSLNVKFSPSLTTLDISKNHLGYENKLLPNSNYIPAIAELTSLTTLNLSENNITLLETSLSNLTLLNTLDISKNSIGSDGAYIISELKSLTKLNINRNNLLPLGAEYISKLTSLTTLNIGGNRIGHLGAEYISKLTSLTMLNISGNYIGQLGALYISNLPLLKSLDIGYNWIDQLGAEHISKLTSLTMLNISGNHIGEKGAYYISQSLTNLVSLNISGGSERWGIGQKGAEYTSTIKSLVKLDISYNNIGTKGAEFISTLPLLTTLDIRENNIDIEFINNLNKKWKILA